MSPSPRKGDDLRARVGQGLPAPLPELLLDYQASIGQERGQRTHVKEPQPGPLHVRPVPGRTGERLAETNDVPYYRCLDLILDPHRGTRSIDSLECIVRCPLLPRPYQRVPSLECEAAAVDEGRPDRGDRGP